MNDISIAILNAKKENRFFQYIFDFLLNDFNKQENMAKELALLHNSHLIDVINEFTSLSKSEKNVDFFLIREVLMHALPEINSNVKEVMRCIKHLILEGGVHLTGCMPMQSFSIFCLRDVSRAREAWQLILECPDEWLDFFVPVFVAGAESDIAYFHDKALLLSYNDSVEIRKRALFSLGSVYYQEENIFTRSLQRFDEIANKYEDDEILGCCIKATFNLFVKNKTKDIECFTVIDKALSAGRDYSLRVASEILISDPDHIPKPLVRIILEKLGNASPVNKVTIKNIDYGISRQISVNNFNDVINFVELFLTKKNSENFSINEFDSFVHALSDNNGVKFNKLATRWLLAGDRIHCYAFKNMLDKLSNKDIQLFVDVDELVGCEHIQLLFLARKAVGYIFMKPVLVAGFILSLLDYVSNEKIAEDIASLLFEPLLINYPGNVREFLASQANIRAGFVKEIINNQIVKLDGYLLALQSNVAIPELFPSTIHRVAYDSHFNRMVSELFKSAQEKSLFYSLATKCVLLYGRRSINHSYHSPGKSTRVEIPMHNIGVQSELPRMSYLDPYGLDKMLRTFRGEKLIP